VNFGDRPLRIGETVQLALLFVAPPLQRRNVLTDQRELAGRSEILPDRARKLHGDEDDERECDRGCRHASNETEDGADSRA